jgi:hypothetical protein
MAQVGVEPTAFLVLSQSGLPIAYRAINIQCPEQDSNLHALGFKPSRSPQLAHPGIGHNSGGRTRTSNRRLNKPQPYHLATPERHQDGGI